MKMTKSHALNIIGKYFPEWSGKFFAADEAAKAIRMAVEIFKEETGKYADDSMSTLAYIANRLEDDSCGNEAPCRSVKDILNELNASEREPCDHYDVFVGNPWDNCDAFPPYEAFVDAWNGNCRGWIDTPGDLIVSTSIEFCGDLDPIITGEYAATKIDYEDFDRYFCDGCCPKELENTFPRWLIMVEPQDE